MFKTLCACDCHCNPYGDPPCQPIINGIASCCQQVKDKNNAKSIIERVKESPLYKLLNKKEEITK